MSCVVRSSCRASRRRLVLDDVHELGSAEARRQLELMLMRGPPALRFVLATRHDLRLGLHRLRLEGELTDSSAAASRSARSSMASRASSARRPLTAALAAASGARRSWLTVASSAARPRSASATRAVCPARPPSSASHHDPGAGGFAATVVIRSSSPYSGEFMGRTSGGTRARHQSSPRPWTLANT